MIESSVYHYSLAEWLLFFYMYCFLGWIWESGYISFKQRQWVNRGFMHGPFLLIYGSGAIMVLIATIPVKEHIGLVFLYGMIGATLLEYVTGVIMEALFHVRYWDYSNRPFNLKGHICLCCSLAWGVFSVLMINVLHKPIEVGVLLLSQPMKEVLSLGLTAAVMIDLTQSFNEAMDLKAMLIQLSQTNVEIQMLRKRLDTVIAIVDTDTAKLKEKLLQSKQAIEERLMEEKKKYEEALRMQLERSQENKDRRKQEIENQLEKITKCKNLALQTLSDKANSYLEQIEAYTKEKGIYPNIDIHPTKEIGKLKLELEEFKEKIKKQTETGFQFKQKTYTRSIKILRRNPNVVSKRYEEALKEIKNLEEKK